MADEAKRSYPVLSVRSWWMLRKKFKQKIPTVVDPDYVGTVLGLNAASAQSNVLSNLRTLGLINTDGTPTKLATQWRDDKDYPQVCKEILVSVYPKSLLEASPDPEKQKDDIKRWFMKTGVGDSAANKMTAIYALLQRGDVESEKEAQDVAGKGQEANRPKRERKPKTPQPKLEGSGVDEKDEQLVGGFPEIHIDIQVHISADSTPDQIDHLFASMAKHLKEFTIKKAK